jgi:hypothetical protein
MKRLSTFLLLACCLICCAHGQQNGDVTVVIHAKTQPENWPTLLVMCDLACKWKLDGEAKGSIDAGGSTKVKVEPGEHMVEVTTEDGMIRLERPSTVKPTGQTMVNIEFQPILDAQAEAEQQARDAAAKAQAAQARALAAKEQAERDAPANALRQGIAFYNQQRNSEALAYFQQSCNLGLAQGCGYEGLMYARGWGTARDYSRSLLLYTKACDGGVAGDCTNLGQFYQFGRAVHKDKAQAKLLFLKGCSMGDETGCKWAKKIH